MTTSYSADYLQGFVHWYSSVQLRCHIVWLVIVLTEALG